MCVPDGVKLYVILYHQCETVVRYSAGTCEPFAVEVGVHQGSALSPFLSAIIMDSPTENIRNESPWQIMFADDVVLCARDKDVLAFELEQWRKGTIHKMTVQPAMLDGTETMPVTSSHVKKREVQEMKMYRWTCGNTLRDNLTEKWWHQGEAEGKERCRKARMRWFGHVKRRYQEYVGRKTLEMVGPTTCVARRAYAASIVCACHVSFIVWLGWS